MSVPVRLLLTAAILIAELLGITVAVDTIALKDATGIAYLVGISARWVIYTVILAAALTLTFAWRSLRPLLHSPVAPPDWPAILSPAALLFHAVAYCLFCWSSIQLCRPGAPSGGSAWLAMLAVVCGICANLSIFLLFIPVHFWNRVRQATPAMAIYCGLSATAASMAVIFSTQWLSAPWLRLTFHAVRVCLSWIRPDVVADSARFLLRTRHFYVVILPACSGYEGVALMLAFGVAWLWFFRREVRFPQALLLVPAGMLAIWLLNIVRLVALFLIGAAGMQKIALGGFHSQAGWISFVGMAILFSAVCQSVPGIALKPARRTEAVPGANPTPAYLMPLLAILAAGMLAQAMSDGFEWLYPLRVIAAVSMLWWFRRDYQRLTQPPGWLAAAGGLLGFLLWIGLELLHAGGTAAVSMPVPLATASSVARIGWLLFRILGGVVTVPIAEELAFRGYLLRRLTEPSFTRIPPPHFSILAFAISSLTFGLLHGSRWIAGTLCGLLYGWLFQRRARLADAVLAHAITNALLVLWVWQTGDWNYW